MGYTIFSQQGFLPVEDLPVPDAGKAAPYIYPVILIPCNPPWHRVSCVGSCPPDFTGLRTGH